MGNDTIPEAQGNTAAQEEVKPTESQEQVVNDGEATGEKESAEGVDVSPESVGNFLDDSSKGDESKSESEENASDEEEGTLIPKSTESAPEVYEFKMPEGMVEDAALTESMSPILKELDLSQGQAQKLIDAYTGHVQARETEAAKAREDFIKQQDKNDREAVMALTDYKEVVLKAKAGSDYLAQSSEEKAYLKEDGNNPILLQMLARLGRQIGEGKFIEGDGGGKNTRDPLESAFPSMNKK